MFVSRVYNDGTLIVGKISGVVEPQSFINGIFWQIDSRNVGEVKEGFSQLYYDLDIEKVLVTAGDIKKIADINTGLGINVGRFRTALVLSNPELIELAKMHQSIARSHGLEVEIFDELEQGFEWLAVENPDPEKIKR